MSITIMRMDNQSGTDTVQYETLPSALEGIKFRPVRSAVTFAPGQNRKTIDVEVLYFERFVKIFDNFGPFSALSNPMSPTNKNLWWCPSRAIG